MTMYYVLVVFTEAKERFRLPRTEVTDSCESSYEY